MTVDQPIFIDTTTMYRWRDLAPVGIVRLERLVAAHLRNRGDLGPVVYVLWDGGYRPADDAETRRLDQLLDAARAVNHPRAASVADVPGGSRTARLKPAVRRAGLRALARFPDHLRPFAEQAAWSTATLAVESARHVRRRRDQQRVEHSARRNRPTRVHHSVDFSSGGDLLALGLGWEYLDHEAMFRLRAEYGLRIHMPAFDLIPIEMPQMNAGQSHLVHQYYAEMAHYADTITSISAATTSALRRFFVDEGLPVPHLATNPLPGFEPVDRDDRDPTLRRHRLDGERFVLSVSTVEIRKNHLLLAKIWTECLREGIDLPTLIIVGRIGWDVEELMRWVGHAPELQGKVVIAADVDDDELSELYHDALFTVFPSRIEGWGLPITEAMTHGKACVHTADPAQFEASQGLMPAFHPDDFLAWKAEIVRLSTDAPYRSHLEQVIAESYVRRTPDEYCADFADLIGTRRGLEQ